LRLKSRDLFSSLLFFSTGDTKDPIIFKFLLAAPCGLLFAFFAAVVPAKHFIGISSTIEHSTTRGERKSPASMEKPFQRFAEKSLSEGERSKQEAI
jgi:hypothetical protein